MNLFRSLLHNIGVVIVGLGVAFLGAGLDFLFGIDGFQSLPTTAAAWLLLTAGFLLRVWAAFNFYQRQMKVIRYRPRRRLLPLALIASQETRSILEGMYLSFSELHY